MVTKAPYRRVRRADDRRRRQLWQPQRATSGLDLPAFANIALKFDGVYQHQDPTVKDPLAGSTGWNYYDRKGGRVAARWTPFDGLTADFSV